MTERSNNQIAKLQARVSIVHFAHCPRQEGQRGGSRRWAYLDACYSKRSNQKNELGHSWIVGVVFIQALRLSTAMSISCIFFLVTHAAPQKEWPSSFKARFNSFCMLVYFSGCVPIILFLVGLWCTRRPLVFFQLKHKIPSMPCINAVQWCPPYQHDPVRPLQ